MKKDIQSDPTKYCRFLRAKDSYGRLGGGSDNWLINDDSNMVCWCIRSAGGTAGPDNGLVTPERCVPGRRCYKAPAE